VEAVFPGDAYIEGCGATHIAELKFGVPVVQILGPNTAIRGRVFNVTGTVRFEDIGVWGEPLALAIDNQFVTTIETGSNGTYTYGFLVDSEATLGPHSLTVALTRGNTSDVQQLVVKSDTTLTATVSNVAGGMFLLFSASLADDHDLPIQGVEIAVANYGLSWTTDTNGNVSFLLDTFKVWPGSVGVAAQFEGSELYIPVTAEKTIVVEPIASLPLFIPLVCPTLVVAVLLYVKHRRTRPQLFSQAIVLEALEEQPHAGMEIAGTPAQDPLRIVFPDIEAALPNVWGVREELRMEVVSDEDALREIRRREVEVSVDAQPIAVARFSSQGRADLSHVFTQKGTHRIQAVAHRASALRPWRAESELRIVDYSEETIRLYNEFLKQLGGHGIHARSEMTAREIQRHILATGEFDPDALHRATACFEKAEYSDHLVARQDYETMYLSLKEMKIDVE
jgi:hypothetical protein